MYESPLSICTSEVSPHLDVSLLYGNQQIDSNLVFVNDAKVRPRGKSERERDLIGRGVLSFAAVLDYPNYSAPDGAIREVGAGNDPAHDSGVAYDKQAIDGSVDYSVRLPVVELRLS